MIDTIGMNRHAHILDHVEHDAKEEIGPLLVAGPVSIEAILPPTFYVVGACIRTLMGDTLGIEVDAVIGSFDWQFVQFLVGALDQLGCKLTDFGRLDLGDRPFRQVTVRRVRRVQLDAVLGLDVGRRHDEQDDSVH